MKKSELNKLVQNYYIIKAKIAKSHDPRLADKLVEIEHRYYHETGNPINQK
jgi:hypothetical protein